MRNSEPPKLPDAYRRDGKLVCVPCSDRTDRDYPSIPRRGDRCSICDEPFDWGCHIEKSCGLCDEDFVEGDERVALMDADEDWFFAHKRCA